MATRSDFPATAEALRADPLFDEWWYYGVELRTRRARREPTQPIDLTSAIEAQGPVPDADTPGDSYTLRLADSA